MKLKKDIIKMLYFGLIPWKKINILTFLSRFLLQQPMVLSEH